MKIGFCCTGNTCRSPLAEAVMRAMLERDAVEGVETISFGLACRGGEEMSEGTNEVLREMGINFTHKAVLFTSEIYADCDVIYTMTAAHKAIIEKITGETGKVFTMAEGAGENGDVIDPYGGGIDVYRRVAMQIIKYADIISKKLKNN